MKESDQYRLWDNEPEQDREPTILPPTDTAPEVPIETAAQMGSGDAEAAVSAAASEAAAEGFGRDAYEPGEPMATARAAQIDRLQPDRFGYDRAGYGDPNHSRQSGFPADDGPPSYGDWSYRMADRDLPNGPLPQAAKPKQSTGFWKKAVALALACTVLSFAAGVGGALLINKTQEKPEEKVGEDPTTLYVTPARENRELSLVSVERGKLMTAVELYQSNVGSTVGITTEVTTTNFWGYQSSNSAAGSGFVLSEDGYILTNEHVIEGANSITVTMYDGESYPATLIGYDASNDIAVLKIEAQGLSPVTLGDSDALQVGEEVVAIGNPLGELTFSLTKGTVSALDRTVTLSNNVTMNLVQTDTAINSGNSGGALFNMYGEVVGITNSKYSSNAFSSSASIDNIGFAIPVNSVKGIVTSIIEKGYISTPYIGVSVANVSEESQSYGMPQGAAIRAVEQGSPAEEGGLQANDIVTAVNGTTISFYEDLKKQITDAQVGDPMEVTVYRRGETLTLTITVGERTTSALPENNEPESGYSGRSGGMPWGFPSNP